MKKKLFLVVLVILFCVGWTSIPGVNTPICKAPGDQYDPKIVSDGFGGAIIVWKDERNAGRVDIYAQRVDAGGTRLWQAGGVPVCTAAGIWDSLTVLTDGKDGAIVVWQEKRSGGKDVYAQRIDDKGNVKWAANGVLICEPTVADYYRNTIRITADGSRGVIVVWINNRSGNLYDIYAQRVNSAGRLLWGEGGVPIRTAASYCRDVSLISSGKGGAIVVWNEDSSSTYWLDIYAQRIDASGTMQWGVNGTPICTGGHSKYDFNLTSDGSGGAIIAWDDFRFSYGYQSESCLSAQRIDSTGRTRWQENGVDVVCGVCSFSAIELIPDGKGGAVLSYQDSFEYWGVLYTFLHIEKIDAFGEYQWSWGAVPRCPEEWDLGLSFRHHFIANGSRGVIVGWRTRCEYEESSDLYIQAFDFSGTELWKTSAEAVCTTYNHLDLVSDGSGGAILTWHDKRGGRNDFDIYVQNVCADGKLGDCTRPAAVIAANRFGGFAPLTIRFDGSASFDPRGSRIIRWYWDFGDGSSAKGEKVSHTYDKPGRYFVELRVKNNHGSSSPRASKPVMVYSPGDLEKVEISFNPSVVKAYGKGLTRVETICYEKQTDPDHIERPIPVDLGLDLTTTSGTWQGEVSFSSGTYTRNLLSGNPGTAVVSAVLDGEVLGTAQVEFTWLKPPVNVALELKENRSLFRGEYYAYLSWSANPEEVFTPAKYRVYRSVNGGAFQLIAEVGADVFTYVDEALPAGSHYRFAVSMVDTAGDESDLSAALPQQTILPLSIRDT